MVSRPFYLAWLYITRSSTRCKVLRCANLCHLCQKPILLTMVEKERSLLMIIRMRQRNWMEHTMRGDSLQREIIEGSMEGKRERGRPRQNYWTGWWARDTANLRKKLNVVKRGAIGSPDLPEVRELKEQDWQQWKNTETSNSNQLTILSYFENITHHVRQFYAGKSKRQVMVVTTTWILEDNLNKASL